VCLLRCSEWVSVPKHSCELRKPFRHLNRFRGAAETSPLIPILDCSGRTIQPETQHMRISDSALRIAHDRSDISGEIPVVVHWSLRREWSSIWKYEVTTLRP
jgi:hypothetical protein